MLTPAKQNILAVGLALLLSGGIYMSIQANPQLLSANIQGVVSPQDRGDIRYTIEKNTLRIITDKVFDKVSGVSALISYNPEKVTLQKSSSIGYGEVSLVDDSGSLQLSIQPKTSYISNNTELFRIDLTGTDTSELVVNDIIVQFIDGTSDIVSVGVER